MLSSRLIHLIQDHWDTITDRVLRQIRADARIRHLGSLPPSEVRDHAQEILRNLGQWLSRTKEPEFAVRFEGIGRQRRGQGVPLHEVVLAHLIIKERMIDFVRSQGLERTTVDIYAEEELEHLVSHVLDSMIYHVVRGYELALTQDASSGVALT